jgi:pimeloyl-ACP methyl ester carboxylesterase
VADIEMAVDRIGRPPVLIGHSMGGMLAQIYAASHPVPGLALLAPVPAEGLGACAYHMSLVAPDLLAQINLVQAFGSHLASPAIIHRAFFTAQTPHTEVMSHMQLMQPESHRAILELMNPWLRPGGCLADRVLVVGGTGDKMVPPDALRRTAAFYEAELVLDDVLPHGMMLDATWVRAALPLRRWLERLPA